MKKLIMISALGLGLIGCATKKPMTKTDTKPTDASSGAKASYVVKKGDSLWNIASRKAVLGDPFRWPLLFKANRDQIQDPDFIEVSQDLSYKKVYSKDEIADAVKKAQDTPPFEPHKQPRKVLPVQY